MNVFIIIKCEINKEYFLRWFDVKPWFLGFVGCGGYGGRHFEVFDGCMICELRGYMIRA